MSDSVERRVGERRVHPNGAPPKDVTLGTTEGDYILMLQSATTLSELRAGLVPWARFAPEAVNVATHMGDRDFKEFRAGLLTCLAHPDGEGELSRQYMVKWGQLVMPDRLTDASKKAEQHNTTLGVVLLGMFGN